MKNVLITTIASAIMLSGILCCVPAQNNTDLSQGKIACNLQTNLQKEKAYSYDNKKIIVQGTGWASQLSNEWLIKRESNRSGYEMYVHRKNFKDVSAVNGSIFVVEWNDCPTKFMSDSVEVYLMTHPVVPIKDAAIEINGQIWYAFIFKTNDDLFGVFATTAKGDHGFVMDCVTTNENGDQTIEVCSEFFSSVVITEKEKSNKLKKEERRKKGSISI